MTELRDCPNCEQGKHQICTEEVLAEDVPLRPGHLKELLNEDEQWVPCPCAVREHSPRRPE